MDTIRRFSPKAKLYHYRWDYAPQAIQTIIDVTRISADSSIADIGSGTGILSHHFIESVNKVFAVEPNSEMRQIATNVLGEFPSFCSIAGVSDATTLPDHSVDLITVGRAIHWFVPEFTRREFLRILKPNGWLAILRVPGTDKTLLEALEKLRTPENGWGLSYGMNRPECRPMTFYYGSENFLTLRFPYPRQETWQEFIGRLVSNSHAPNEDNPYYGNFENLAQKNFNQFSANGRITLNTCTELFLGHIK